MSRPMFSEVVYLAGFRKGSNDVHTFSPHLLANYASGLEYQPKTNFPRNRCRHKGLSYISNLIDILFGLPEFYLKFNNL